jgi:hypothetical protein
MRNIRELAKDLKAAIDKIHQSRDSPGQLKTAIEAARTKASHLMEAAEEHTDAPTGASGASGATGGASGAVGATGGASGASGAP